MLQSDFATRAAGVPAAKRPPGTSPRAGGWRRELESLLADVESAVPPLWPLQDYVAVNPFLGLSHHRFLDARQLLCGVQDCDLLPSREYFRERLRRGDISLADVEGACRQSAREQPGRHAASDVDEVLRRIEDASPRPGGERRFHTVAEVVDRRQGGSWSSHIVNDISRHCAAHYDQGQAAWPSPWRQLPLYDAWRRAARLSKRMDRLGLRGFRKLVAELPAAPQQAVAVLLEVLGIPAGCRREFLLCELMSVGGWASLVKYRGDQAELAGERSADLTGLLAIRLAYDAALAGSQLRPSPGELCRDVADRRARDASPSPDAAARELMQAAAEIAYRRRLCGSLVAGAWASPAESPAGRKTAQLIFCIDVRSEVMRRHLESLGGSLETFGFAGFFGMAAEYVPLGESRGTAQCPALLQPAFRVEERLPGADSAAQSRAVRSRQTRRTGRRLWKKFQASAVSCFSFVESLGLLYFGKLLGDSLRLTRPAADASRDGVTGGRQPRPGPDVHGESVLSAVRKADLAEGMLRNLGLTEDFARIVVVCGHGAEAVNNPYKAGLDCGACGGHSGEPNARIAAALLNDGQVRRMLADRGIAVPEDTWFVPAVHNTTTDEIQFLDAELVAETHVNELRQLQSWTDEAGRLCRVERSGRLGGPPAPGRGQKSDAARHADILRRSRDWSETRPEWGLAGNAAFIVAPRRRTAGLDLGGRAFLHSYDHRRDPDLKVLELIMTAPMIVANWINLQYYASAVDNRAFGSGNKVLHNVVGQLGVLQGNGGDLMVGLPWQSVHDGLELQHEPLRLLVVIEAPRDAVQQIIDRHQLVRDLATGGWLSLVVIEGERLYRLGADGRWLAEPPQPADDDNGGEADSSGASLEARMAAT